MSRVRIVLGALCDILTTVRRYAYGLTTDQSSGGRTPSALSRKPWAEALSSKSCPRRLKDKLPDYESDVVGSIPTEGADKVFSRLIGLVCSFPRGYLITYLARAATVPLVDWR